MYKVIEKFGIKSGVLFISMVLVLHACNQDNYAKTEANYGEEVEKYAKEYNLSPAYLKALIVLECSGNKPAGERFEPSVYQKLKEVKNGTRTRFEFVTRKQIRDCSDGALRNLATSWGPFQIMGYKCIHLGIIINDLRGDESIKWGVKWINNEYGKLVRNKDFDKAFRVHNTGSVHGNTYDPNYVSNGLQHIDENSPVFVSLNPNITIDEDKIYDICEFSHPVFDRSAINAQEEIHKIQGSNKLWFCGAYLKYGFHEDGISSAINVVRTMGKDLPW
jgi:hypothetical protein